MTSGTLRHPVSDFGATVHQLVEVEPPEHFAVVIYEEEEGAMPCLLLRNGFSVPLREVDEIRIAAVRD